MADNHKNLRGTSAQESQNRKDPHMIISLGLLRGLYRWICRISLLLLFRIRFKGMKRLLIRMIRMIRMIRIRIIHRIIREDKDNVAKIQLMLKRKCM